MGTEFQFWKVKRVVEMGSDDGCTTYFMPLTVRLTMVVLEIDPQNGYAGTCMLGVVYHNFLKRSLESPTVIWGSLDYRDGN